MFFGVFAINFFKAIARAVAGRFKGQGANSGKSLAPEFFQRVRRVERIAVVITVKVSIGKLTVEQAKVVVRAIGFLAILAAGVETYGFTWAALSESLEKFLQMFGYQG